MGPCSGTLSPGNKHTYTRKNLSAVSEPHCAVTNTQGTRGAWIPTQKAEVLSADRPMGTAEPGAASPAGTDTGACTGTHTGASAIQKPRDSLCPAVLSQAKCCMGNTYAKTQIWLHSFPILLNCLFRETKFWQKKTLLDLLQTNPLPTFAFY